MDSEPDQSTVSTMVRPGLVILGAALAGLVGGAAAGLIDGIWSYGALDQFLATLTGKLRLLSHLALSYGLAASVVAGAAGSAFMVLSRYTRLGEFARFACAVHNERRRTDPRECMTGLSLVLAGAPITAASLGLSYWLAYQNLATRKHPGLVIGIAMGVGIVALAGAAVATLVAARPIETALQSLCRHKRLALAMSSPRAPLALSGVLALVAGGVGVGIGWSTLDLLPLRPYWVVLVLLVLCAGALPVGARLATRLDRVPALLRRGGLVALLAAIFALIVVTGASESVRKASELYSGLGTPLAKAYRQLGDWDRDHYSAWLGGGDCDDFDSQVHPGATDIPDDGIDSNCVGGDRSIKADPNSTRFSPVPPKLPKDFNVILISIDTIRADHLGAYGYKRATTPNIDALAAEGTLFDNGWAHAPSTRYSIPALLTGRHPLKVRYKPIGNQWPGLSDDNLTIAEVMKSQGLTTGAILNYWYFDANRKMNQGFDHYDNQNKRLHKAVGGKGPAKTSGSSSKEQTDKAISYVDTHSQERFFLWVHYYDPHFDYEEHEGITRFGSAKIDKYDHEIAFTDSHIGRLLDHLRKQGLYDKTVIVLTGDHGEGFGEHGIDLHGYHLYAAQTKVPLVIRVPGVEPSRVEMPASHVDILPTLANLSGAKSSLDMLGRSLVGVISGAEDRQQERWIFQQLSYENNNEYRGAASAKCHVLFNVSPNLSWELYRIDTDPLEARDIIDNPGDCAPARGVLEAWYDRSEIPEGAVEALLDSPPTIESPLNTDFGSALRLLAVDMPSRIKRGENFDLELTWQALGRPPKGWKVFAHFENPKGGRFTGDHAPTRPFTWWKEGQYIKYRHRVSIPKSSQPGSYALWFGLFKKNERLEAAGSLTIKDDRVKVGSIEVTQ